MIYSKPLVTVSGVTPELTRAERAAHKIMEQINDERNAIEASG
jgi:hypothetical protein